MEKAIYGMAMPLNDSYYDFDPASNTFTIDKTNPDAVIIDGYVGATMNHDFSRTLGLTGENLILQKNERGVFFKLIPDSPSGLSAYKKVKRGALRHCSCCYFVRKAPRNVQAEQMAAASASAVGIKENIIVREYRKIILYEVCLTNNPANKATFCTIDKDHPLLQGLKWDEHPAGGKDLSPVGRSERTNGGTS
ncbi:hypothetical protein J31TS4_40590 [Paenibacillus sp. J31TS4]|uniref:HK97 family phage prohead protease n=1 Tax=Paenibacillus sp. J31TS4 TaxID=2807195 RepID=UPI001B17CBD0|nr:HK97 family phage prohead protease [Paenibacillus sp. J31TS4]GIP40779.1 hypothetical protein J31TS4_40590 [Paenibacillus sp. J31TS4]